MWNVAITYNDQSNFLVDKTLFSAAINSVITYLNSFIAGTGTINLTVDVSQTATGRFAGGGAVAFDHTGSDGLNYFVPETAKELAKGTNLNGTNFDLVVMVDPTSDYFKSLSFDPGAYLDPRTVPGGKTDGQTVLLHEIMHGLGLSSYRDWKTGEFQSNGRSVWDTYVQKNGAQYALAVPEFAARGLAPIQVTMDSAEENYSHLANHANLDQGYVDDLMNGLYFYLGHRYYMSQVDLMILKGLGYDVTIPDNLPLSYHGYEGKGLVTPALSGNPLLASMTSNVLHLSGTAAAGAMTSVLEHGTLLATATADAAGQWSMDVTIDPSRTTSSLVVRDGSHAMDSNSVAVSRDTDVGSHLFASAQYSKLVGGSHDDVFTLARSGVSIDGGAGFDTVECSGTRASCSIQKQGDGFLIKDATGTDTLAGVERVHFTDGMVALDVGTDGTAGQAYRIYQAAFNRAPDAVGLGFWINAMDHGESLQDVAKGFVASNEFTALYGAKPSNADILGRYYQNVLHRQPDTAGYQYWLDALDHHGASAADVLASFAQSQENQTALAAVIGSGISYTPYG